MKNPNGSIDTLIGYAQIVMPGIGTIKRLPHRRETMFLETIDLALLEASKKIYHG